MSLLDDVSIVVTPNGYKAGELYAVIPVPSDGAEEITNGDFATDTDWVKGTGWTISGGSATSDGSGTSFLYQIISNAQTKRFLIEYEVKDYVSGSVSIVLGSAGSDQLTSSSNGVVSGIVLWDGTSDRLNFKSVSLIGSIDNVSVKEYTSADMDVTRATAATRVDENGLVNYAEILGDNLTTPLDFTTWVNSSATDITANSFTTSGVGEGVFFSLTTNKLYKINVSGVTGDISLRYRDGGGGGTVLGAFDTDLYFDTSGLTSPNIYLRSLSATTATVTSVSFKEAARDNVPRIDYTGGGCPHILAEPQRTNIAKYSEQLDVSPNVIDNANYTSNFYVSPNGLTTAPKFEETTANDRHGFYQYQTVTSNSYTVSIYTKQINRRYICLQSDLTSINQFTFFDLQLGTVVSEGTGWTATIDSVGSNGWYRLAATCTAVTGSRFSIWGGSVDGLSNTYVGDGSLFTFWGLQVEQGSYPTSYIPTSGSTVTRNQDIFTRDGIGSLINSEEGVLFWETASLVSSDVTRYLSLSDGGVNKINFRYTSTINQIAVFMNVAGVTQAAFTVTISDVTILNKFAFKWKVNDFALWINGSEVGTDNSGIVFPVDTLDRLNLADTNGTSSPFFGKVKQLQVFKTALTDTQLAALTS